MSLALDYRPRVFTDVAGQRATAAVLWSMASHDDVPEGLLFHGPSGTGKTTMARILGSALVCEAGPGPGASWPCGSCAACKAVRDGSSLDVIEVDAASFGTADEVRALRQRVLYGTGSGQHRVVILDECHAMSEAAFNALLKVLEEPPSGVHWVLLTTNPGKVLGTVAGRCSPFEFRRVTPAVITARLTGICTAEDIHAEPALLAALAERANGQVRDAVVLLEQARAAGITSYEQWGKLHGEPDFAPVLLSAAASGDFARAYGTLAEVLAETSDYSWVTRQLTMCLRDVLVLCCDSEIAASGTALAARQELAARLGPGRAGEAMRVLWDLHTKFRVEDRRAGLDMAVLMLAEQLGARPAVAPAAVQPKTQEELASMFGARA